MDEPELTDVSLSEYARTNRQMIRQVRSDVHEMKDYARKSFYALLAMLATLIGSLITGLIALL